MRRLFGASAEALIIVILVIGLMAVPVFAAKGGGAQASGKPTAGASISLVLLDSTDGAAHHGQRVSFTVSTTATDRPFVRLHCWQGATGVYNNSIGIFPTYLYDPWLTLDSSYWTAGAEASCTATVYYYDRRGNQKFMNSLVFAVAP